MAKVTILARVSLVFAKRDMGYEINIIAQQNLNLNFKVSHCPRAEFYLSSIHTPYL